MRIWHRTVVTGIALTAALAINLAPAAAAGPRTRWVDDDGHAGPGGCGGAASAATTIQGAVDASHANDTVIVCPGTYVGQVRIRGHRNGLTVRSSTPYGAAIKAPASVASPLGFRYLVLVDHTDRVTVHGFRVITRTQAPCESLDVAVAVVESRQVVIRGNRLLAPGAGPGADCDQGIGIAVADEVTGGQVGGGAPGFTGSAVVASNEVRDARFGGIAAFAETGHTNVRIEGNSVRAYFGAPPTGHSSIVDPGGQFGIGFIGRSRGVAHANVVQGSGGAPLGGPGFYAGIAVIGGFDGPSSSGRNGPIDIRDNLVRRVGYGVLTQGARWLTVRGNTIGNTQLGMAFAGLTDSIVRHDTVSAKSGGILLAPDSTGNSIRDNRVAGPGGTCQDASSGGGTSGTANHWSGDHASQGSSPGGLCSPIP